MSLLGFLSDPAPPVEEVRASWLYCLTFGSKPPTAAKCKARTQQEKPPLFGRFFCISSCHRAARFALFHVGDRFRSAGLSLSAEEHTRIEKAHLYIFTTAPI